MSQLTRTEIRRLAKKCYHNPQWYHEGEFEEDLKIIGYIKRQLSTKKDTNYHLILNHMITMTNVFGVLGTVALLRGACDIEYYPTLNSFFFFLSIIPGGEGEIQVDKEALSWLYNELPDMAVETTNENE